MGKVKPIPIAKIRTDGGTQMREEIQSEVFQDYRDKWLSGVVFDPVDVFFDGVVYWLADGFHRFYGAREAERKTIPATVHNGSVRDAILFACGANATHGLRRTNADKRRAVESLLGDQEWVKWSDRKVAEQAAVSDNLVREVRKQLRESRSSKDDDTDQPRIGRDGKARRHPRPRGRIQLTPSRMFDHDSDNGTNSRLTETPARPTAPPPSPFAFLADTASDLCSILPKVITAWESLNTPQRHSVVRYVASLVKG